MSRLAESLPCLRSRPNVVTPIVCLVDESAMPEIDGVAPTIRYYYRYHSLTKLSEMLFVLELLIFEVLLVLNQLIALALLAMSGLK